MGRIDLCQLADDYVGGKTGPLSECPQPLLATPTVALATVGVVGGAVGIGVGVGNLIVKGDEEEPSPPPEASAARGSAAATLLSIRRGH